MTLQLAEKLAFDKVLKGRSLFSCAAQVLIFDTPSGLQSLCENRVWAGMMVLTIQDSAPQGRLSVAQRAAEGGTLGKALISTPPRGL